MPHSRDPLTLKVIPQMYYYATHSERHAIVSWEEKTTDLHTLCRLDVHQDTKSNVFVCCTRLYLYLYFDING